MDLTAGHIERGDQRLGAVADVFKLAPFDLPRLQRQPRRRALQRLNARHFIDRHCCFFLCGALARRRVRRTDVSRLFLFVWIGLRRQPIAHLLRL